MGLGPGGRTNFPWLRRAICPTLVPAGCWGGRLHLRGLGPLSVTAGETVFGRVAAIRQAQAALARLAASRDALDDPLVVVAYESLLAADVQVDVRPLLEHFSRISLGYGRENANRFRWGL